MHGRKRPFPQGLEFGAADVLARARSALPPRNSSSALILTFTTPIEVSDD